MKTYLISGQKVKEPHCSCSQALLPSLEAGDGARMQAAPSAENAADSTKALKHMEKPKVSPPSKSSDRVPGKPHQFAYELLALCIYIHICVCV